MDQPTKPSPALGTTPAEPDAPPDVGTPFPPPTGATPDPCVTNKPDQGAPPNEPPDVGTPNPPPTG